MASPADGSARKRPRQHLALLTSADASAQQEKTLNFMDAIDTRAEARRELGNTVTQLQEELTILREEKEQADRQTVRLKASPAL